MSYATDRVIRNETIIEKDIWRFLSIVFDLERTNQLNPLPDKDLVDLCPPIEPYQVTKNRFKRAFQRLISKNPQLQSKVSEVLHLLADNPFTPSLKSHKLTGRLEAYWSCSVSYDCRIIFTFRKDTDSGETLIVIVDIGKHDQVY